MMNYKIMKILPVALLLLPSTIFAQDSTWKTIPMSGDDIAHILELSGCNKMAATFDKPKYVIFRIESHGGKTDFTLPAQTSRVTLLTYMPGKGGAVKDFHFWLTGDQDGLSAGCAVEKTKYSIVNLANGSYTITGADTESMAHPKYQMQLLTSDDKPK